MVLQHGRIALTHSSLERSRYLSVLIWLQEILVDNVCQGKTKKVLSGFSYFHSSS